MWKVLDSYFKSIQLYLICNSISNYIYLSVYVKPCNPLSAHISIYILLCMIIYLSICIFICACFLMWIYLSLSFYVYHFIWVSLSFQTFIYLKTFCKLVSLSPSYLSVSFFCLPVCLFLIHSIFVTFNHSIFHLFLFNHLVNYLVLGQYVCGKKKYFTLICYPRNKNYIDISGT